MARRRQIGARAVVARFAAPFAVVILVALGVLGGCGTDDGSSATDADDGSSATDADDGSSETGTDASIEIGDRFFAPTSLTVSSGETVTVTVVNRGALDHTFTVDDIGVDEVVPAGETVRVELTAPGEATGFYCRFHPEMQGTFVVTGTATSPTSAVTPSGGGPGY